MEHDCLYHPVYTLTILTGSTEVTREFVKNRVLARNYVWWPGMNREIQDLVQNCRRCAQELNRSYEPLIPSALPERPWQRVATDLLHLKGSTYLAVVDYYSRYIELAKLSPSGTDSPGTIERLKSMFARHGIPEELVFRWRTPV